MLHTYSSIYHQQCILFFSHYLSFLLSVSFHAPYLFIHIPLTLYNVFPPVLKFSPVSIIPLMLHTHPITSVFPCQYHSTNAPYSSHYFNFPLSVSFHAPYLFIHIPPMLYNVLLPLLKFSPVSIIPPVFHSFILYQCHIFLAVYSIIKQHALHILCWS